MLELSSPNNRSSCCRLSSKKPPKNQQDKFQPITYIPLSGRPPSQALHTVSDSIPFSSISQTLSQYLAGPLRTTTVLLAQLEETKPQHLLTRRKAPTAGGRDHHQCLSRFLVIVVIRKSFYVVSPGTKPRAKRVNVGTI